MPSLEKCKDCKEEVMVSGRGLCHLCYNYHHNHHTLDQFPRSTWKREELVAEHDFWRRRGLSVRESAERIGVTYSALRKAMQRHRLLTTSTCALWGQDLLSRKIN